jgi:hypothetical protein
MRKVLIQNAAHTMLLDASRYQTFVIRCATSIVTMQVMNVSPGMLYCFVMQQDANGNHTVNWDANMQNAMSVDPEPNSTTVQTFIGTKGDILTTNVPGTWTQKG